MNDRDDRGQRIHALIQKIEERRKAVEVALEAELTKLRPGDEPRFWKRDLWHVGQVQSGGYSYYSRRRPNDKLFVSVGKYGSKRTFPEPKKGFDLPKIAKQISDLIEQEVQTEKYRKEANERHKIHAATAQSIRAQLSIPEFMSPLESGANGLSLKLHKDVNAEQAVQVLQLLIELRLVEVKP